MDTPLAGAGDAVAVRAARREDLPAFVALLEEAGARGWARGVRRWPPGTQRAQEGEMARWLREGALLLACDAQGPVAGAILSAAPIGIWRGAPGPALVAHELAVADRAEGCGVGRRLLARTGWLAHREGAAWLRLDCDDDDARLRALYREAGLREAGVVVAHGKRVRRLEARPADVASAAPPLPLAEPLPRIPPPPRRTREPLPPYRFVPGRAPHPVRHPQGHARGAPAPDLADLDPARLDRCAAFRRGADLFDAAYWWEAHEAWEAPWQALGRRGPAADALRGLILLAAACLKHFQGATPTARRLAARGLARLGPRPVGLPGLDVRTLAEALHAYLATPDGRPPWIPDRPPAGPPPLESARRGADTHGGSSPASEGGEA